MSSEYFDPVTRGALGGAFNTLALSGTSKESPYESKHPITVVGMGVDLTDLDTLENWAKRKLVTQTMSRYLIEVAKSHSDWKWEHRFWSTYNCQSEIITSGGRSHANHCRQRCCTMCLAIRKAEKLNLYLPIVKTWSSPYFLTITAQSVKKEGLEQRFDETVMALRRIIAKYKKRHQRGTEKHKFKGIWALECNFNPEAKTYNPHIHLILPNIYIATTIKREWMQYWKKRKVRISKDAQYNRKVKTDIGQDLIEIVKYGSKIFTEPDVYNKSEEKNTAFIYAAALYNILRAMETHDVFNTFGLAPLKVGKPPRMSTIIDDYTKWEYNVAITDWYSDEYRQKLTDYKVPDNLRELLDYRINTDLE